jgi:hypothetical protein
MEKNVASLRARSATLGKKREAAKDALDRAVSARQSFAVDGDLDDTAAADRTMAKLNSAVDSARSVLSGLDDAIAEVTERLIAAENELTAERETAARAAAADKIAGDLAALAPMIEQHLASGRKLGDHLGKFTLVFDAPALAGFVARSTGEIELAAAVVTREIDAAIDRIRNGTDRIPADAVQPVAVVEAAPPAPLQTVFLTRHAKYRDPETGLVVKLHRFQDAQLSPHLADVALRSTAAVAISDPIRKQLSGRWPPMNSSEHAFDLDAVDVSALPPLDAIEAQQAAEVIDVQEAPDYAEPPVARHTAFEKIDRGAPYTISPPRRAVP